MTLDPKDPNDIAKDYSINWAGELLSSEAIIASTWIVPADITKDADSFTGTATRIWLSGGTAGRYYPLVNRVIINSIPPRTQDATITIRVKEL
jgi:hypothetical protein